jgi:hypothetical protein
MWLFTNEIIIVYCEVEWTWKETDVLYIYTQFLYLLGEPKETLISAVVCGVWCVVCVCVCFFFCGCDRYHCLN